MKHPVPVYLAALVVTFGNNCVYRKSTSLCRAVGMSENLVGDNINVVGIICPHQLIGFTDL